MLDIIYLILFVIIGVLIGIFVGSVPGMTATMTVALLVPFTFNLSGFEALGLLLGVYFSAVYAGSIPAILIGTPGTPSSAATVLDGYPMTKAGDSQSAIIFATVASVIAGTLSAGIFAFLGPITAHIAIIFSSPEYFWLGVFGLVVVAGVSDDLVKGFIAGLFGVMITLVGIDPLLGNFRFTFGITYLNSGFELIPVLIGLFGFSEVIRRYLDVFGKNQAKVIGQGEGTDQKPRINVETVVISLKSGVIGTVIGILPGSGGSIASFVSYNEIKQRYNQTSPKFGDGNFRGVIASEAGNNSSTGGALIPTLTLGIPGDAVTAVLIGALLMHGFDPGPALLLENNDLVWTIFGIMLVAYVSILITGYYLSDIWSRLVTVPAEILWPVVGVMCVVGSYVLRSNLTDVSVMFVGGVIGYLFARENYPLAPVVIGIIIGPLLEKNIRRSLLVSDGSLLILFKGIPSLIIIILIIVSSITIYVKR